MRGKVYLTFFLLIASLFGTGCGQKTAKKNILVPPYVDDGNEPPRNPYLADSPWPMTHRNPYCQDSSPYAGPYDVSNGKFWHIEGLPGAITLAYGGEYPDGKRVVWGADQLYVYKLSYSPDKGLKYIDRVKLEYVASVTDVFNPDIGISGAYTLVDRDNIFYVPKLQKLYAYGDTVTGDPMSPIKLLRVFQLPSDKLVSPAEKIVGLNMTYDGMLVLVTDRGLLLTLSRDFKEAYYFRFPEDEEISNSIAVDEEGGIYVVTSEKMYRVQWTGEELTLDEDKGGWSADYDTGENYLGGIRLGKGSGTTPSLMGVGSQDKFVVITDGDKLMHIVLFWRNEIPDEWKKLPGAKDRRIAAQVAVTFGNPDTDQSTTDQSLVVRGYGVVVVSNQLRAKTDSKALGIILSGVDEFKPLGVEKFVWDPAEKKLYSEWADPDESFPNGIPAMSAATGLLYDIANHKRVWSWDALDWHTGKLIFSYKLGFFPEYNSAYAGTEVGLQRELISGSLFGAMILFP